MGGTGAAGSSRRTWVWPLPEPSDHTLGVRARARGGGTVPWKKRRCRTRAGDWGSRGRGRDSRTPAGSSRCQARSGQAFWGQARAEARQGLLGERVGGEALSPSAGRALFPRGEHLGVPRGSPPALTLSSCHQAARAQGSAYLPSGEVILHQGAHDLLGRLGGAEVGGEGLAQNPLSVADPAWGGSGPRSAPTLLPTPHRTPISGRGLGLGFRPPPGSQLPGV